MAVIAIVIVVILVIAAAAVYFSGMLTTTPSSTNSSSVVVSTAGSLSPTSTGASGSNPIVIGMITQQSGYNPLLGQEQIQGAQLAINETNSNGGVLGRPLTLVPCDEGPGTSAAVSCAQILVSQDHVNFMVGPSLSGDVSAVLPYLYQNNMLTILTEASQDSLLIPPQNALLFRTGLSDQGYAFFGAQWLQTIHAKSVALVGEDYVYTHETFNETKAYIANGTSVTVSSEDYFPGTASDYSAEVNKLASSQPSATIVIMSGPNGIDFQKQYAANPLTSKIPILYLDSVLDEANNGQSIISAVPTGMNDVFIGEALTHTNLTNAFIQKLVNTYKIPYESYTVEMYQAINVLVAGIKSANSIDPHAVANALTNLTYCGPYGCLKFQSNHNPTYGLGWYTGSILQSSVANGQLKYSVVWPPSGSNASMINPATGSPFA